MTAIEKIEAEEQRQRIFDKANWVCEVCGGPINKYGTAQLAHRIARSKMNIQKYGATVINHSLNLAPVCCLLHNDAVNIGFRTEEVLSLVNKIQEAIERGEK